MIGAEFLDKLNHQQRAAARPIRRLRERSQCDYAALSSYFVISSLTRLVVEI
jgi:hypothetical protein